MLKRRNHDAALKARGALGALKGARTRVGIGERLWGASEDDSIGESRSWRAPPVFLSAAARPPPPPGSPGTPSAICTPGSWG